MAPHWCLCIIGVVGLAMNLRAMPAVIYVAIRASHAGRVKGDRPVQKRYPGPPGWGLGHEADNLIPVKMNC
jgi:hypothetical protein